ncbi:hypothetical protein CsSME_00039635 [Camellia sinensis var. sinensis]
MATSRPPSKPLDLDITIVSAKAPEERELASRRPQTLRHLLGRPGPPSRHQVRTIPPASAPSSSAAPPAAPRARSASRSPSEAETPHVPCPWQNQPLHVFPLPY